MEQADEEQGIDLDYLAHWGTLLGASAPWLMLGAILVNATRSPIDQFGFSGYVSNPDAITPIPPPAPGAPITLSVDPIANALGAKPETASGANATPEGYVRITLTGAGFAGPGTQIVQTRADGSGNYSVQFTLTISGTITVTAADLATGRISAPFQIENQVPLRG